MRLDHLLSKELLFCAHGCGLVVDVAVGVTATFLFCINFRVDAHRQGWMLLLCVARVCDQFSANMVLGMLACCWVSGAAHGLRTAFALCVVVVVLLACT